MAAPKRVSRVVPLKAEPGTVPGVLVGTLVGLSDDGPLIDYPGNFHGPLCALSTVRFSRSELEEAVARGRQVVLAFDQGRGDKPILTGLVEPMPKAADETSLEAVFDGKRVVIDGHDEVVLRCGKASITLRRNGRVVVRGTYVEAHSEGVNRIKGGVVKIN